MSIQLGHPAALYLSTDPDWAPSLHLGHDKLQRSSSDDLGRHERRMKRQKISLEHHLAAAPEMLPVPEVEAEQTHCVAVQTDLTMDDLHKLEMEFNHVTVDRVALRKHIDDHKLNEESFRTDEAKVKFYTGLPNFVVLMTVFNFVSPHITHNNRSVLCKFQQLILCLMRLRLNLSLQDLAYRFTISTTTASKIFINVINVMYYRLNKLVKWPSREELVKTMPMCYRANFGTKVTCIIDCFEIFMDRPSNVMARAQTWSSYKHHNTVKFLIGITPQGVISFISKGWGGRVSDKYLTEHCGFMDNIMPGDVVLADRGFDLSDAMGLKCATIKIPSFMKGKKQLSLSDVVNTRKIASVRIHVERVIGHARQKYAIMNGPIPLDYVMSKDDNNLTLFDKIAHCSCSLTNLSPPIVPMN